MNWLARIFHRRRFRSELSEEIRAHLDELTEQLVAKGISPEEARAAARREFGNVFRIEEDSVEVWRWPRLEDFLIDIRYGLRLLAKDPGFITIAVFTLALGIGANTAIFTVADAAWLRSWPGQSPKQLAKLLAATPQGTDNYFSFPDYSDLERQVHSFEGIAAWSRHAKTLRVGTDSQSVLDDLVSPNYFTVLGVAPQLGHVFSLEPDQACTAVVVISDSLWKRAFHSDRDLVGKQVSLNGGSYTVIGVAPPHFHGLEPGVPTDLWLPVATEYDASQLRDRHNRDFELLARLRSGVSPGQARVELQTVGRRLADAYPATDKARDIRLLSESERLRKAIVPVVVLMTLIGLVMLICCANVAGLILARSQTRHREIAVRLALGAGRFRLLRQLLTESSLLAVSSALLGLLFARWLLTMQPAFMPPSDFALGLDLRINLSVIAFTVLLSALTVLVVGLAPALQALKPDLASALKDDTFSRFSLARGFGTRSLFVVAEIAMSVVLLTASGLLVRSLLFSHRIDLGFDSRRNLIFFDLAPGVANYHAEQSAVYFTLVSRQIAAIPGVSRATFARRVLLSDSGGGATLPVSIPGVELPQGQQNIPIKFNAVAPGYFQTVGTHLLGGRFFSNADISSTAGVVIISSTLALRYWPRHNALGQHLIAAGKDCEVVGIVEDAKINHIHESTEPYLYVPFAQVPSNEGTLIVEALDDPRLLVASVRNRIRDVNPDVPVTVRTLPYLMRQAFWQDQMSCSFVVALSLLGMFLAAVGLYGVIAFTANQRRREIGIRMALGAENRNVLALILAEGLKLTALGTVIGLLVSLAAMRILAGALYGIKPTDPPAFLTAATIAILVAAVSSYFPARRAARVDPIDALRYE